MINPLIATLKLHSIGTSYSNTVIAIHWPLMDGLLHLVQGEGAWRYSSRFRKSCSLPQVLFGTNKSVAMRIGVRHNAVCEPFVLSCNKLMFVQSVKYLGIILLADKKIKYSIDHLKVKFYWVFNCIYCRSRGANSKLVSVEQQSNIYFAVKWISNLPLNTALLSYHITEINACLLW